MYNPLRDALRRKLICLVCFVLVLGMVITSGANAADPNLVGWWKLDEGSGNTAIDSSGNGFDIPLQNNTWGNGVFGGAIHFPGEGQGQLGSFNYSNNAITVCAWVWHEAFRSGQVERYVTAEPEIAVIRKETDGRLHFYINTGGTLRHLWVGNVLTEGQWHHVAGTWDGLTQRLYLDGVEIASQTPGGVLNGTSGVRLSNAPEPLNGMLDDARIYNRALTEQEINGVMLGAGAEYPYASGASPKDGTLFEDTWVNLSWRAGDFAVSHDVYFGDNFNDVNDGDPGAPAFRGSQADTFFIAGFPGFPFPDGLVPGTTYYWRIDEVNDAEPNSPWKGPVWSFSIPPKKAYNPIPADNAKFIATDTTLEWTGGFGAKLHHFYFGDNFDDVSNAAGALPQAMTTFNPGPLEPEKTYYWRVDEFDVSETHKGDIWSFITAKVGGGVKGQYFKGMNFENLVLTRTDPQIDFSWGNAAPDPLVGEDNFSARWTGQVEAAFTETYTFYTNSDDGVHLWVDGKQLVNNWTDHGSTENKGTIDLVAGQTYSVVMELYENGGGAVAQLSWSSASTPKQLIPAAALSFLVNAHSPSPANGTVGVKLVSNLTWKPGDSAGSHEVYLGTDAGAVAAATKASPEYKGGKALGEESLDPGALAFDTSYFWRVDEVNNTNPDSPWTGNVWTLNTGDFLVVDNFEPYNDIDPPDAASNRIFDKWIDGFGTTTNGALVGNDLPPYAEQSTVYGGGQSMIYRFDNAGKTSEATLTLVWPRDFTQEGVTKLSLWFRGSSANAGERMYVALNGNAVVYHADPVATQIATWTEWVIDLTEFAGVDLTNVNTVTIGFGTQNSPAAGGTGTMFFDDVRLIR
ncbi:MAG: hypothetical protein CEE38_00110 [Planctomycetes bacterium B3_Pla]|nr:MAG: hypothetical protein CEE38_00110 [Planctomycetes bacterium B3_Pla]